VRNQGSIPYRHEIFSLLHSMQSSSEPTQSPIQHVPRAVFLGLKQQGCETDHSTPSSARVKSDGVLHMSSLCGA
jgi:hypothetical protein